MKTIFVFALLLSSIVINAQNPYYYYYKGKKIDLVVDENYLNVVVNDDAFQKSSIINFTLCWAELPASVAINGSQLTEGMYLYALIIDNQVIDTKKMILTE